MPDEPRLRQQARAAVKSGAPSPLAGSDVGWARGRRGVHGVWTASEKNQMEFEIEFARDGDSPGLDKFHVHVRCFAASEFERTKA